MAPNTQPRRETYYEFTIAADEEFMHMYRRVRSLQSIKAVPGQDISATFKALMREHIARHAPEEKQKRRLKRKKGKLRRQSVRETTDRETPVHNAPNNHVTDHDAPEPKTLDLGTPTLERHEDKRPRSRYIPAATKDGVLVRDHYQCTYIGIDGVRCRATQHLQFDHVTPFASTIPAHGLSLCTLRGIMLSAQSTGSKRDLWTGSSDCHPGTHAALLFLSPLETEGVVLACAATPSEQPTATARGRRSFWQAGTQL